VDGDGNPLDGTNRYVVHVAHGESPPANAFWSLTLYNDGQFFIHNPIDRYAIGGRYDLTVNGDGSIDIWIQHDSPGTERESNWLPSLGATFNVILRIYFPKQQVLDGTWTPPPVQRLN
jgi:hypothetical protein